MLFKFRFRLYLKVKYFFFSVYWIVWWLRFCFWFFWRRVYFFERWREERSVFIVYCVSCSFGVSRKWICFRSFYEKKKKRWFWLWIKFKVRF